MSFDTLARELAARFRRGVSVAWSEHEFEALALRAFELQYASSPAYRGFCEGRGATPASVGSWADVPAVPATAFKHLDFVVGAPEDAEAVFVTSGTTREGRRGRHIVRDLGLYRSALVPAFRANLVPDADRLAFLSLVPSPEVAPDSSLSFMVAAAADELSSGVAWLLSRDGSLDEQRLVDSMEEASGSGAPVLFLGTALAFVHLLERSDRIGPLPALPEGSRVMETGGFKGRERDVSRHTLYEGIERVLGVPPGRIVNEYGMTELLSQLYEPVLSGAVEAPRRHRAPPWLKVRALDPVTLIEVEEGEEGLLCFFDLANAGSICHVLTEDVGRVTAGDVHLTGRVQGSEPRGCSRAVDELMSAAGEFR